ncbi:MAG: SMI1/KNR4 family protein [Ignavibacteriae bacterium]|nr:SMI1/KNR4 family protein [Ignavibacteriota bacterium]NOG99579.1 SMI1/KNR4 family protein [Ignavibacteriota bacterium]
MKISDLQNYFNSRKEEFSLSYKFGAPIGKDEISNVEEKFEILFPEQVREFYTNYNGMKVQEPAFEIYSLNKLRILDNYLIFAKFNNEHEVAFDISKINQADQWNIMNIENGYCVTLTMASFWSNKIPA